jgi:hypothetical protein
MSPGHQSLTAFERVTLKYDVGAVNAVLNHSVKLTTGLCLHHVLV